MTNETALKPDLFTLTKTNLVVQYWSEDVLSIKFYKPLPQPRVYVNIVCVADVIQQIQSRLETSDYSCVCGAPYLHLARSTKLPVSNHRGKSPQYMLTDAPNRKPDWNGLNTSFSFKSSNWTVRVATALLSMDQIDLNWFFLKLVFKHSSVFDTDPGKNESLYTSCILIVTVAEISRENFLRSRWVHVNLLTWVSRSWQILKRKR